MIFKTHTLFQIICLLQYQVYTFESIWQYRVISLFMKWKMKKIICTKLFYLKKKYITTLQKKLQHLEINIQKRENRTMHIKSLQKSLWWLCKCFEQIYVLTDTLHKIHGYAWKVYIQKLHLEIPHWGILHSSFEYKPTICIYLSQVT